MKDVPEFGSSKPKTGNNSRSPLRMAPYNLFLILIFAEKEKTYFQVCLLSVGSFGNLTQEYTKLQLPPTLQLPNS